MGIAKSYTAHLVGLTIEVITVEVDISNGLNAVSIVGLGDRAVEESKDRVSAAVKNIGYASPKQKNQKVVISLAPADVRKEGPSFDVAIAVAYLRAAREIECDLEGALFLGELSLEGNIRRVTGVLPMICQAERHGFKRIFIPAANAEEASLASGIEVYAVASLRRLLGSLDGSEPLDALSTGRIDDPERAAAAIDETSVDMRMICGNEAAKRGLEIAAAGVHNILMYGPPGTGKTMLAQSFRTILPPLTREEAIEVTSIHSAARALGQGLICAPPFRAPHHTASYPAVIGGGAIPRPGEITLAHRGVLFLDEFPEFDRSVLEALRQPLEDHSITVARAKGSVTFPAQCILIASMNPCPCGKRQIGGCTCQPNEVRLYERRMSGPVLDRLDIWLNVSKIDYDKLAEKNAQSETSAVMRERVIRARAVQARRFAARGMKKRFNSEMGPEDIQKLVTLSSLARIELRESAKLHGLSGRAFHRVIKVAQTIADLEEAAFITKKHILEALQYRQKADSSSPPIKSSMQARSVDAWLTDKAPDPRMGSGPRGSRSGYAGQ
jgi:magnesium chelatase family protein